ncbi:hypothetical protein ABT236_35080 [Streptomyces sp. NPDC001523]|uniref:hypothetical protein n=1 Tax=Streptomyces sp. NPDC001523 TaxID=3154383 RepID=UPI003324C121
MAERRWGAKSPMTAGGTVHATRPSTLMEACGRVPACMTDHTAAALTMLLRSGRPVTCGHCPKN